MKPVFQTIKHEPAEGRFGDCHRAAIATVLELPIEDVPHFLHDNCGGVEFVRRETEFLASHGLCPISVVYANTELNLVLSTVAALNGDDVVYLLCGKSRTGCNHSVVCRGDRIAHDPSPQQSGIIGPTDEGTYCLTFFADRRVSKHADELPKPHRVSA